LAQQIDCPDTCVISLCQITIDLFLTSFWEQPEVGLRIGGHSIYQEKVLILLEPSIRRQEYIPYSAEADPTGKLQKGSKHVEGNYN